MFGVVSCPWQFLQVCVKAERLVLTDDRFQNLTEQQVTLLEAPRPQFLAQQEQAQGGAGDWRDGGAGEREEVTMGVNRRELAEKNALRLTVVLKDDATTVVQVILRKAGLMWPYMLDLGLVWRISVCPRCCSASACLLEPLVWTASSSLCCSHFPALLRVYLRHSRIIAGLSRYVCVHCCKPLPRTSACMCMCMSVCVCLRSVRLCRMP